MWEQTNTERALERLNSALVDNLREVEDIYKGRLQSNEEEKKSLRKDIKELKKDNDLLRKRNRKLAEDNENLLDKIFEMKRQRK